MQKQLNLLITAASSDIGSALFSKVAADPLNRVVTTSFRTNLNHLVDLAASCQHLHGVDLTDQDDLRRLSRAVAEMFDSPFGWLHCAGDFWHHKRIEETPLEEARSMIASHYLTLYSTAQIVLPIMKQVGGGRVLAFSCNSVRYSYPEMAAFTPAKAAVESLVRCLANESLEWNILLNCLALPTVATPKVMASKQPEYHPHYVTMEELIEAILGCLSTMSPLATGNSIAVVKHSPYFYQEGYYRRNRPIEG